jgi:hypothetical protein
MAVKRSQTSEPALV